MWKDIGIELDLKVTDLDTINETSHGNVKKCFSEMLTLWLKRVNPPPTWTAMVDALKEPAVGFEALAEQVMGEFLEAEPKRKIPKIDSSPVIGTCEYIAIVQV